MNYNKIRRNVKAISPVISVLLMIAVAVAASLVAYAWVMGYIGFTVGKTGKAIQIQSVTAQDVYVQNIGDSDLKLASFYVNGVLDNTATVVSGTTPLTPWGSQLLAKTGTAQIHATAAFTTPQVTVKVVTVDGISAEFTKTFP